MTIIRDVKIVDEPACLLRPLTRIAWAKWRDWRSEAAEVMPSWQVFSPMQHTKWLPHLMLWNIKQNKASEARVVLTGQDVARHLGVESINAKIEEAIPPSNLDHLIKCLQFCIDEAKPAYMIKSMEWRDRGHIIYDSLLLPFKKDDQNIRILGMLHFDVKPDEVQEDLLNPTASS